VEKVKLVFDKSTEKRIQQTLSAAATMPDAAVLQSTAVA